MIRRDGRARTATSKRPWAVLLRWIQLATLCSATACDAIVDTTSEQCQTDSDCETKFGNSRCSAEKVCISAACSTTKECNDRFEQESYCRPVDSTCTPLLTEDCSEVYPAGALSRDDVILVGFMGPLRGSGSEYGVPLLEGAKLAFADFEETGGGLPGALGSGTRHLAMLVCNNTSDLDEAAAVARHLTDVVKVPAILGPATSGVTLRVFDAVARPAGVLVLSASATSPALAERRTNGQDQNLLWRTAPSDVVQAEVMKAMLPSVEQALADEGALKPGERANVAVIYKADPAGKGLFDAIRSESTLANPAPAIDYSVFTSYDQDLSRVDWQVQWDKLIGDHDEPPNVIVPLGTDEFVVQLLPIIEERWPDDTARPWYLLPEGARADSLSDFAGKNPELELPARILGTAPGARRSPLYRDFQGLFSQGSPGNLAEFAYDAAYLLAYAIARTNDQFPTGLRLGSVLTEMTCKSEGSKVIQARSRDFAAGFNAAANERCVDFDGASGSLDFDPVSHDAVSDIALWCVRTKPSLTVQQNIQTYFAVEDVQDAATKTVRQGMVRKEGTRALDLAETDWCNVNVEGRGR